MDTTADQTPNSSFPLSLGQVVVTKSLWCTLASTADDATTLRRIAALLEQHRRGDWGDLDPDDVASNDHAALHGGRLLSAYQCHGTRVWVITEADRSVTTVLLPEDY
jgi:hypothetical protein